MLPTPNTTAAGSPNTVLQASGALSGARFTVDAQNNNALSTFGGIVQIPYGPFAVRCCNRAAIMTGRDCNIIGSASAAIRRQREMPSREMSGRRISISDSRNSS